MASNYIIEKQLLSHVNITLHYILLKALPPICMKYTAGDENQVANMAWGKAKSYICHETLIKSYIFHTNKAAVL